MSPSDFIIKNSKAPKYCIKLNDQEVILLISILKLYRLTQEEKYEMILDAIFDRLLDKLYNNLN